MLLNSLLVALLATAPIAVFAAPVASPGELASPGDDLIKRQVLLDFSKLSANNPISDLGNGKIDLPLATADIDFGTLTEDLVKRQLLPPILDLTPLTGDLPILAGLTGHGNGKVKRDVTGVQATTEDLLNADRNTLLAYLADQINGKVKRQNDLLDLIGGGVETTLDGVGEDLTDYAPSFE